MATTSKHIDGQDNQLMFNLSIKMGNKGDLSDFDGC